MTKIAITETMEQVHKHLEKYLGLHREISDESEILRGGLRELYGDANPSEILKQAEINSLVAARSRFMADKKKNPWIDTTAQGDLFHNVTLKVPSMMMIDGKPRPYYETSIVDGMEWWRGRADAKRSEASAFRDAADVADKSRDEAASQVEKLTKLINEAMNHGIDPRTVLYAKTI